MEDIEFIRSKLTEEDLKGLMAEETCELYQAISKLNRAEKNVPGSVISAEEAKEMITEEITDVSFCADLLGIIPVENRTVPMSINGAFLACYELLGTLQRTDPIRIKQSFEISALRNWCVEKVGINLDEVKEIRDKKMKRFVGRIKKWEKENEQKQEE